jgi:transposase
MRNRRNFSVEFKRQVVEEWLSGTSRPAQLCRRHNVSASLLYHWKKQYSRGKFNNEPTEEGELRDRIEKLERLVGRLTLENEFLKKGLQNSLSQSVRNGNSSRNGCISFPLSSGGVKS